ncbi:hypothetical protein CSC94_05950 [Zhengella mangrovi]|uniref:Uncharacterized protein n=1 Tax=Zhengella mangrovi TaxID=1982044 RepID=A0A2G1QRP1_9HYPH|nr:helix-turn-helix domain-containing protein [Zhengella mangrovi]PHP68193.1 hypothetical protein CSC94_05950 [Zhengella mangrovi]
MMAGKSDDNASVRDGVDLFGAPISQIRERWGRPSFRKDKENQRLVALLRAKGWSHKRIAGYIGCSEPTLRKNFFRELQAGADMIEADLLQVLYTKARAGNVGAVNKLLDHLELNPAFGGDDRKKLDEEDKPERLGKKALLEREAQEPPSGWSDTLN